MKLIDYMWAHDENKPLVVKRGRKTVSVYDGKNSIDERYNNCKVLGIAIFGDCVVVHIK